MKTIATINWILIGVYGLLLLFTLVNIGRSGNDAAGQGMEGGVIVLGVIGLAAMIGLNMLPYNWTKLTALIIQALPLLLLVYNLISNYFDTSQRQ